MSLWDLFRRPRQNDPVLGELGKIQTAGSTVMVVRVRSGTATGAERAEDTSARSAKFRRGWILGVTSNTVHQIAFRRLLRTFTTF